MPSRKLSERQIAILQILTAHRSCSLRDIMGLLENPPAARTVGDDLAYLKRIKLVDSRGVGRGAKWLLINKKQANGAENGAGK